MPKFQGNLQLTRTPSPADRHIKDFCARVVVGSKPRLMAIIPAPDALPLERFPNVAKAVSAGGGRIIFGWSIWEWPGVYLEAEHHAVYEDAKGDWFDITPSQFPKITHRLFIADENATYDFQSEGARRDNIRHALVRDPLIQTFFESSKAYNAIMDSIPGFGEVRVPAAIARQLEAVQMQNARATYLLAMKYTPRNSPCFCGGGKKFKKCHGAGHP
jgi:hypothetical protein